MQLSNISDNKLLDYCRNSYRLYGSNITTARLIIQGLERKHNDLGFLSILADFYTEKINEVAAVVYYFIYINREQLMLDDYDYFMRMFSDAMFQFGLSKMKINGAPTLGNIFDYTKWNFDIESLKLHSNNLSDDYGSIELFIDAVIGKLGQLCGFYKKYTGANPKEEIPRNLEKSDEYFKWLKSFPDEISKLDG